MAYLIRLVLLLSALLLGNESKDKYFLDTTTEPPPEETTGWGGGIGSNAPQPELGVVVELVAVDRGVYRFAADSITYEIRLTNKGKETVKIPWSLDSSLVFGRGKSRPPKQPFSSGMIASLGLYISTDQGRRATLAAKRLYAATNYPKSYRLLGPNESCLIRVSGSLGFDVTAVMDPSLGKSPLPGTFQVNGFFELQDFSNTRYYKQLQSQNAVHIRIEEPSTSDEKR